MANVSALVDSVITNDQIIIRLISQLINGIAKLIQNILKYFNDNAISTSFMLPVSGVSSVILALSLND